MDAPGLSFTIVAIDDDPSYPAVEVRASNGRYAAATTIWMALGDLSEFAECIAGFPVSREDERRFEFGHRSGEVGFGGVPWVRGFCSLRFEFNQLGSAGVILYFEDDESPADVSFRVPIEAAELDRLVSSLRALASGGPRSMIGSMASLRGSA